MTASHGQHAQSPHALEVVVFFSGAVVMILELVGSRMLAPYLGTSLHVWTNLIGVILGSLSVGYWCGGRLADRHTSSLALSRILLAAGCGISVTSFVDAPLLHALQTTEVDIRIKVLVATLLLLGPPSVLLAMVLPYAVRMRMASLSASGATAGRLYALSTIGSLVGTYAAGWFLIAYFGTAKILLVLAGLLIGLALLAFPRRSGFGQAAGLLVLLIILHRAQPAAARPGASIVIDVDTPYNRIWVEDGTDEATGRPIRTMRVGGERDSAVFRDGEGLVFDYLKFYRLARHFNPTLQHVLMIGGGAYAFPKDFLRTFPQATVDVVELDPKVTELAARYFGLSSDPRLTIYHEDGRTFLNTTTHTYDAIFLDAFSAFCSIPYQLTTHEAAQAMRRCLRNNGLVMVNIISALDGPQGRLLRAAFRTFKTVFSQVYLFPVGGQDPALVQNIMLVALSSPQALLLRSPDPELSGSLAHLYRGVVVDDGPILTDDYAPVDQYLASINPSWKLSRASR